MNSPTLLRIALPLALALPIGAQTTIRVTAGLGGAEPSGPSASPAISGDGRFVVFTSTAENLAANDTRGSGNRPIQPQRVESERRTQRFLHR